MKPEIDHLVYATDDLEIGIESIEKVLGVWPVLGGKHVGLGTHNALVAIGEGVYIEIIAPDPEQGPHDQPLPFGLDTVTTPRLAAIAARTTDIDALVATARERGYDPGEVVSMSRERPDGETLRWRIALRRDRPGGGIVPFILDWGETPHPSRDMPSGGTLAGVRAEHPEPESLTPALRALDFDLDVTRGGAPAIIAKIESKRGVVELR